MQYTLSALERSNDVLTATIRYQFDGLSAEQRFSVRDIDNDRLAELADTAGLRLDSSLNAPGTLVLLRASDPANRGHRPRLKPHAKGRTAGGGHPPPAASGSFTAHGSRGHTERRA